MDSEIKQQIEDIIHLQQWALELEGGGQQVVLHRKRLRLQNDSAHLLKALSME